MKSGWKAHASSLAAATLALNLAFIPRANASSFLTVGSLNSDRYYHTATLLSNGKVLVTGGYTTTTSSALPSAELYDPATGTWSYTGSLNTGRYSHTATMLTNGQVLVVGGIDTNFNISGSAELYNPLTGTWSNTGPLNVPRYTHTATLLPDGRVLVAGGQSPTGTTNSAELYDPSSGTWTPTGSLSIPRRYHSATLLANGTVLVAGGQSTGISSAAELYDPSFGTWSSTGSMTTNRELHTAVFLTTGRVLVAGGRTIGTGLAAELKTTQLYNPGTGAWATNKPMSTVREYHTATLLPNGTVLVTGGYESGALNTAELYNSGSGGSWTTTTTAMNTSRYYHTATLLADGRVLIVGGYDGISSSLASVELYDPLVNPPDNTWGTTGSMNGVRLTHTATLLPNGQVLVAGGIDRSLTPLSTAELYDPINAIWTNTGPLNIPRYRHRALLLHNGQVLVVGGITNSISLRATTTAELYDPTTGTWSLTGSMGTARSFHTATLMPNGWVLVAGGINLSNTEVYNPMTGTWTPTAAMHYPRDRHSATLLTNGKVLVAGGENISAETGELYDPATGTWTMAGTLKSSSYAHTATLLPNGKVLLAGGEYNVSELYNPESGGWEWTANLNYYHLDGTATLLPNGQVMFAGGIDTYGNVYPNAELYDPSTAAPTNRWANTGSLNNARESHTATLLPNGGVLVTGGFDGTNALSSAEGISIGLNFGYGSPVLSTATSPLTNGASLILAGSGFRGLSEGSSGNSTQDSATDFPVVQLLSLDNEQTSCLLASNWSTNSFTSLPLTNLRPGYAMVTVSVNGIPGSAAIVAIATPPRPPVILTNLTVLTNGAFQFSFTDNYTPLASYTVLAAPNLSLPLSNWVSLGTATETSYGHYQFTDLSAALSQERFYVIRSP